MAQCNEIMKELQNESETHMHLKKLIELQENKSSALAAKTSKKEQVKHKLAILLKILVHNARNFFSSH